MLLGKRSRSLPEREFLAITVVGYVGEGGLLLPPSLIVTPFLCFSGSDGERSLIRGDMLSCRESWSPLAAAASVPAGSPSTPPAAAAAAGVSKTTDLGEIWESLFR